MKVCGVCKVPKDESEFNKKKNGFQYCCRLCQHKNFKSYYNKNREYNIDKTRKRRQALTQFLKEQKIGLVCKICGESRIACLDFHHRDSKEKDHNISTMARSGLSKEKILKEIEKCDVLCANCHRVWHSEH